MNDFIKNAIASHKSLFITTIATVTLLKLSVVAPPLIIGNIVDGLTQAGGFDHKTIWLLIIAFFSAGTAQIIATPLQSYFLARFTQSTICDISIEWSRAILNKDFGNFTSVRLGQLIKSVERGITAHEQLLNFITISALPTSIEFLIIIGIFLYIGGPSPLLLLLLLSTIYLFATHQIIIWRRKHIDSVNDKEDYASAVFTTTFQAAKSIKLENAVSSAIKPLNAAYREYAKVAVTVATSGSLLTSAKILFTTAATGGLITWGVLDQISSHPQMTTGELVSLLSLATIFLVNIASLSDAYRLLDQFFADQDRLHSLLSLPDFESPDRTKSIDLKEKQRLAISPCSISDKGTARLDLQAHLHFVQGESVAIIGPSGSGKSSLLESLAGITESTRGNLTINCIPVDQLSANEHLSALRYCPQMPAFLEGELSQSLFYGQEYKEDFENHLRKLQLENFSPTYFRKINENASNISGGEAKRLSLLRLINKPGFFNFFDEPTASLDKKLATPVWDLLFEKFAEHSLICVTHDIEALSRFDRVIVMHQGRVISQGEWKGLSADPAIKPILQEMEN